MRIEFVLGELNENLIFNLLSILTVYRIDSNKRLALRCKSFRLFNTVLIQAQWTVTFMEGGGGGLKTRWDHIQF